MSSEADQASHRRESALGGFRCLVCQQKFGRVEHLTRHSRSHSKDRYLKCSYCQKGFYRNDALQRHEQVHKEPKRSTLGRGIRACLACAKARRKCSGGNPCPACDKRSIDCSYPHPSNAKSGSSGKGVGTDSMTSSDEQSTELPREEAMPSCQAITNGQGSPGSWSNMSHSPAAVDKSHDELELSAPGRHYNSNTSILAMPEIEAARFQNMDSDGAYAAMQPPTPPGPHSNMLGHSHKTSTVMPLPPFLRDSMMDFQQGVGSDARETWSSGGSTLQQMSVDTNSQLSRTADPNFWSQNNLSSINWLPDNWIPNFDFSSGGPPQQNDYPAPPQTSQDHSMNVRDVYSAVSHLSRSTPSFNSDQGIASPTSDSQGVGSYYVDGDGARLPRVRKAPHRSPHQSSNPYTPLPDVDGPEFTHGKFEFQGTEYGTQDVPAVSSLGTNQIPVEVYSEILHVFTQTCVTSTYFSTFNSEDFPSLESLGFFIHLYIEHFQPILPFIHPATFSLSSSHWLLTLAMAAIGSSYVDIEDVEILVVAMHEFLRRAINMVLESGNNSNPDRLTFTQVRLLNCIGMMYCGDNSLVERARACSSDLIAFCGMEWINPIVKDDDSARSFASNQVACEWKAWCHAESHRRTGYSIWLLDCMWSFQFQLRSLLSLEDAKVPVPCQEVLWEAVTALEWQQLYSCSMENPSLHEAVQILYVEKRLQSSMGEFSRILCIHALFRRTWEVEAYFKQPLTLWSPVAEKQDIKSKETSHPVWLPGIQTYSRWRNSACDCLDVLHWHANSVIGAASGMEHPTVLHLHLARVVLLTPFRQIEHLAQLMTREREPKSDLETTEIRSHIRRWAMEDQHKARLAMIHAGVLFWHVRRYSIDGFYEPSSVFLATLALWAYGTFAQNTSGPTGDIQSPHGDGDGDVDAESLFPTSIQLDRPADDELVQLFVKRGGLMRANITGVGNLCSARGPGRVLLEGRKLLVDLKCWGYWRKAVWTLTFLADACQRENIG